ncbi:MAG: cyclic-di-AMP receptor [Firmicutes bacterium]|nr:cyclic-di-AMP receptor [Bacillota bacterium]
MKLILAIVNKFDSKTVVSELMKGGFSTTVVASQGGFLRNGTATLLLGTHAERVDYAIEILKHTCRSRKYDINKVTREYRPIVENEYENKEIVVGGATVFVLNIEESIKI